MVWKILRVAQQRIFQVEEIGTVDEDKCGKMKWKVADITGMTLLKGEFLKMKETAACEPRDIFYNTLKLRIKNLYCVINNKRIVNFGACPLKAILLKI